MGWQEQVGLYESVFCHQTQFMNHEDGEIYGSCHALMTSCLCKAVKTCLTSTSDISQESVSHLSLTSDFQLFITPVWLYFTLFLHITKHYPLPSIGLKRKVDPKRTFLSSFVHPLSSEHRWRYFEKRQWSSLFFGNQRFYMSIAITYLLHFSVTLVLQLHAHVSSTS